MTRQRDRGRLTILLLVISSVVGYVTTSAIISLNSALSSSTQNSIATIPLTEGSLVAVNGSSSCRQVLGEGFPLYATAGQVSTYLQTINGGQQVELVNGTNTVLGEDGLPYIFVSVPYASQNFKQGYMQSQVRIASSGELESTLGMCSPSSSNSNTGNNSSNNTPNNPIDGYW
jgi:hypothetical protein